MCFGSQVVARLRHLLQPSPYFGALRELPTHRGVPPSRQFLLGHKHRFMLPNGERMSVLTGPQGDRYVLSQRQGHGSYGKLRVALDFAGQLYAVKELRLVTRAKARQEPGLGHDSSVYTKVSSPQMILEEIAMMAAASRRMRVHTCFEVEGKVYLFLPLMADDATLLSTGTPGFARVMVGRQILQQVCEDLASIHQRGFIHHDVKLQNILWNGEGEASLADFGLSCPVDEKTGTTCAVGRTAGNMPLEYELGKPFSWSLDTFMLGLAMADYYAPQGGTKPATGQAIGQLLALEAWRGKLLDSDGHVDVRLIGHLSGLLSSEQIWDAYFAKVCAVDPTMGGFIIERMLNRHAAARASLAQVRAFVETLAPPSGPAARMAVRVMHTIAVNDWERQRLLRHMRHFKMCVQPRALRVSAPGLWARIKSSTACFGVGHQHARQSVGAHQTGVDDLLDIACDHERGECHT